MVSCKCVCLSNYKCNGIINYKVGQKKSAKQLGNITVEEKLIQLSKLNEVAGVLELAKDFDEKAELRDYFENKHL